MLVKITSMCRMGCSHCMEDAKPEGTHMTSETFDKVIDLILRENLMFMMISGGEPTDHPEFASFVKRALAAGIMKVMVTSNGMFLNTDKRDEFLSLGTEYQITNDPNYYPVHVEEYKHPAIQIFAREVWGNITPLGRAKTNGLQATRKGPMCFNVRSACRSMGNFWRAVLQLRMMGKFCAPAISAEGDIVAGESRFCKKIGTVDSTNEELTRACINMTCNKCGLMDGLSALHRSAVGEL